MEENRNCILEMGSSEDVKAVVMAEISNAGTQMPIVFKIVPNGNGRWSVFSEDSSWKPRNNMSCVDKVDGIFRRTGDFMRRHSDKTLFIKIEGEIGVRGMNYFLELA